MPRKIKLTWQPGGNGRQGRWKKKYRGRTLYLGLADSKSDIAAYKQAYACWLEEKQRIDSEDAAVPKPHQAAYEAVISDWALALRWSLESGDEMMATRARRKLADLNQRLERKKPSPIVDDDHFLNQFSWPTELLESVAMMLPTVSPPVDPNSPTVVKPSQRAIDSMDGTPSRIRREVWKDRLQRTEATNDDQSDSIGYQLNRFLAEEQSRVEAKQLSPGRFTSKRNNLLHFEKWIGATTSLSALTSEQILNYRRELLSLIKAKKLARDTAHDRLGDATAFIRMLWANEVIEQLPRVLAGHSKKLAIGKTVSTPQVFTGDEIKLLLEESSERTKLYLLLALNCGMYQGDISNLHPSEVDWEAGTIKRKRSKTRKHENVPTVRYTLWSETLNLLRKFRSNSQDHVLLNANGGVLVDRGLKEDGKPRVNDAIKNAFNRLKKKTGVNKSFKLLRKTAATLIRGNERFNGLESLFLGLSPRGIADQHYAQPPEELLAAATQWLGSQYGVK